MRRAVFPPEGVDEEHLGQLIMTVIRVHGELEQFCPDRRALGPILLYTLGLQMEWPMLPRDGREAVQHPDRRCGRCEDPAQLWREYGGLNRVVCASCEWVCHQL